MLSISLDYVAPPYLHILLGVTKKHHDLLESECHLLDKKIAECMAKNPHGFDTTDCTKAFTDYVIQLRQVENEQEEKRKLETQLVFADLLPVHDESELRAVQDGLQQRIDEKEDKISELEANLKLPLLSGPVTEHLDSVLEKHKICKQAYHGRAFIGSHCHKYMQSQAINSLCDSVVTETEELVTEQQLRHRVGEICSKFKDLNTLYGRIHSKISHARPVNKEDINFLNEDIKSYMTFYRKTFTETRITPKQHLLEYHCVPFMERFGFGLGLHGEQGGEEIHAVINQRKRRAWGMKSNKERLRVMMTQQLMSIAPALQNVQWTRRRRLMKT